MSIMSRQPRLPQARPDYMPFEGGLDLQTPPWTVKPGKLRVCRNFEIDINGGYRMSSGYERFDGRARPSSAAYKVLTVTTTGEFSTGDTVTGATSGATGVVVALILTDAATTGLVLTKVSGTFQAENLEVSAVVEGTASADAQANAATTRKLHAQYRNLAADEYRGDIAAVPGSGSILGVWALNDVVYAFRNNSGGTATDLYKSTSSGWSQIALGKELSFTSGGTTEIAEGNTITGATSGATATVDRVVLTSGTWAGGNAAGKFILSGQTGTFQAENLDVGVSTNLATIAGDSTQITLSPSGRYSFVTNNFGGATDETRIYGADGVNKGFEFDGSVYVPIDTGMTTDTPKHIAVFEKHLFFSFGSSVQHSGLDSPYTWSPITGASEINVGSAVTGFLALPGSQGEGALAIFGEHSTHVLYGNSSSDWNLIRYREEIGALDYTQQQVGLTMFMSEHGIMDLEAVQEYGNFAHTERSRDIHDLITEKRSLVVGSAISRAKSQYRLFFSDGSAFYVTVNGKRIRGITKIELTDAATCLCSIENTSGAEEIYFGSTDGMVYQMEKGTSHDGDDIEYTFMTHWHHSGSVRMEKRWLDAALEVNGDGYAEFQVGYEIGYGTPLRAQADNVTKIVELDEGRWDDFTWDQFFWDGIAISPMTLSLRARCENISLVIRASGDYFNPMTFSGAMFRTLVTRMMRA